MTTTRPAHAPGAPEQDFTAALHEIESNVDVRRLMIVVVHVLVPATAVGVVSAGTGSDYPEPIAWLPGQLPWLVGGVLAVGGIWTSLILARCHFGMVVNGAKLRKVVSGDLGLAGLNWLGVTTNFLAITALTSAVGAMLIGVACGWPLVGAAAGATLAIGLLAVLRIQHFRANRLVQRLAPSWQTGDVPATLREEHLRKSLDATSADVSIVVTMAAALFAGAFDAMANVGGLVQQILPDVPLDVLKTDGLIALSAFTFVSLLLSARIVVRLRIALAQHSAALAALRHEPDTPWSFRPTERTYLLFLTVILLTAAVALIGAWTLGGPRVATATAAAVGLLGVTWYPLQLRRAARRAAA